MIRKPKLFAAMASAFLVLGSGLQASTLGYEVVDFEDLGNAGNKSGNPYISDGGFYFNPTNANSDTKCEGNKCLGQDNSTGPNSITSVTLGLDPFGLSSPGDNIDWSLYNSFNLKGFYFALVGNNSDIIVEGVFSDGSSVSRQYKVGFSSPADFDAGEVTFAEPFGSAAAGDNASVLDNAGGNGPFYFANLGTMFTGVSKVFFYSDQNSNVRLDCVYLEGHLTGTAQSSSCGNSPPTVPVPVPAAGILLITALGGLGFAARRRKAA